MRQIFWGFFFLFFDFHWSLNNRYILQLLPNFVGWLLLYRGMGMLSAESSRFAAARPFAVGLGIYSALLWVKDLLGFSSEIDNFVGVGLSILYTVVSYFVIFLLVSGIREMEQTHSADLQGERLQRLWLVLLITNLLAYFSYVFSIVTVLCGIVSFVAFVLFLIHIHRAWKQYARLPAAIFTKEAQ